MTKKVTYGIIIASTIFLLLASFILVYTKLVTFKVIGITWIGIIVLSLIGFLIYYFRIKKTVIPIDELPTDLNKILEDTIEYTKRKGIQPIDIRVRTKKVGSANNPTSFFIFEGNDYWDLTKKTVTLININKVSERSFYYDMKNKLTEKFILEELISMAEKRDLYKTYRGRTVSPITGSVSDIEEKTPREEEEKKEGKELQ